MPSVFVFSLSVCIFYFYPSARARPLRDSTVSIRVASPPGVSCPEYRKKVWTWKELCHEIWGFTRSSLNCHRLFSSLLKLTNKFGEVNFSKNEKTVHLYVFIRKVGFYTCSFFCFNQYVSLTDIIIKIPRSTRRKRKPVNAKKSILDTASILVFLPLSNQICPYFPSMFFTNMTV